MPPGMVGKDKMEVRWKEGIWIGNREKSNEAIIGTTGCIKVRSIRRKPEGQRWGGTAWQEMKGTPWEPVPGHPERELKSKVIMPREEILQPPEAEERKYQPRRVYIRARDVRKYGATAGCEGCRAAIPGGENRGHTEECRTRIEKAMAEDQGVRVKRAKDKIDERIGQMVEEMIGKQEEEERNKRKREEEGDTEPPPPAVRPKDGP